MKISEEFSGGLMKAADLGRDAVTYTIKDAKLQQLKEDEPKKLVLGFDETTSELALNATNRKMLVELMGDDTDDWMGQPITLYKGKVSFQGNMVDSIKIDDRPLAAVPPSRPAPPRAAPANRAPATPARRAANAQKQQATAALAADYDPDADDSDPFSDENENIDTPAQRELMAVGNDAPSYPAN